MLMETIIFKTGTIKSLYQSLFLDCREKFPNVIQLPLHSTKLNLILDKINNCIDDKCCDLEICSQLESLFEITTDPYEILFNSTTIKLCEYIVINNCTDSIDIIKKKIPNIFNSYIISNICMMTDNIDLYVKYCDPTSSEHQDNNNYDCFKFICLSLLYTGEPNKITKYITNNYHNNHDKKIKMIICCRQKYLSVESIQYVIDCCKISINDIDLQDFFEHYNDSDIINIVDTLISNCTREGYNTNPKIFPMIKKVVHSKKLNLIKYFLNKYPLTNHKYLKILMMSNSLDLFLHMCTFINLDDLKVDHFYHAEIFNYDIVKWLIDYGFVIRPQINSEFLDLNVIHIIFDDAINKFDYNYIQTNLDEVYLDILYDEHDNTELLIKIINLVKLNILKYPTLVSDAIESNNITILKILFDNGFTVDDYYNVMSDLENILHDTTVNPHILQNIDIMIQILKIDNII